MCFKNNKTLPALKLFKVIANLFISYWFTQVRCGFSEVSIHLLLIETKQRNIDFQI